MLTISGWESVNSWLWLGWQAEQIQVYLVPGGCCATSFACTHHTSPGQVEIRSQLAVLKHASVSPVSFTPKQWWCIWWLQSSVPSSISLLIVSRGKAPCTSSLTAVGTPTMLDTPTNDSLHTLTWEWLTQFYNFTTVFRWHVIFSKGRRLFQSKPSSRKMMSLFWTIMFTLYWRCSDGERVISVSAVAVMNTIS